MSLEEQIAQTVDHVLFTRLCNSLFAAEYGHEYQPIDGTRGDEGNDGWLNSEQRIFAIYCPLKPERRTDANYRKKAYGDIKKAVLLRDNGRYPVTRWTFVTPRKLSNDVIVAIRKRGEDCGLDANHIEATHLSALLLRHPQLAKEFPDYHVSQLEELLKAALESPAVHDPESRSAPENNIFRATDIEQSELRDDELKEVFALRESSDRAAAKLALRLFVYQSINPLVQVNAVMGLIDLFWPLDDDTQDLADMCESARGAARRLGSKSAEAYLVAQKGHLFSFEFGRLAIERYSRVMAESTIGFSLESPLAAAQQQKRLEQLSKGYAEAFNDAIALAQESRSVSALAEVLLSIGSAAGQRAMMLAKIGSKAASSHEKGVCKKSCLAAKDLYAEVGDEHGVANAQMNLANQLRFLGETEEAMALVKVIIPTAEKFGDKDLRRKAGWLEESLRTGKIPDYVAGERREE